LEENGPQEGNRRSLAKVEYAGSRLLVERVSDSLYKCPICGALFATPKDLVAHIIAHALGVTSNRKRAPERG